MDQERDRKDNERRKLARHQIDTQLDAENKRRIARNHQEQTYQVWDKDRIGYRYDEDNAPADWEKPDLDKIVKNDPVALYLAQLDQLDKKHGDVGAQVRKREMFGQQYADHIKQTGEARVREVMDATNKMIQLEHEDPDFKKDREEAFQRWEKRRMGDRYAEYTGDLGEGLSGGFIKGGIAGFGNDPEDKFIRNLAPHTDWKELAQAINLAQARVKANAPSKMEFLFGKVADAFDNPVMGGISTALGMMG
jgi:hypothetical protein